ncbi:MAG: FmdB family zinc ribbon protein [Mycobacterium leprae]
MPIFEFKCNSCEHVFDELVSRDAQGEALKCPHCGKVGARKLVSTFAAHGLENGHIGVGWKLTGKGSSTPSGSSSESSEAKSSPAAD